MTQLAEIVRPAAQDSHLSGLAQLFAQEVNPNDIVKAFAANTAFRAAERTELSTEGNPYRRPVRPDDLAWLDYSKPLPAADALKLSALLGHRMLRNAYDGDLLYLPPAEDPAAMADGAAFYSPRHRLCSALAAPILENHLFTYVDDQRPSLRETSLNGFIAHVSEYFQQRVAEPGKAFDVALRTRQKAEAATFAILQLSAYAPAASIAVASGLRGDYRQARPGLHELLMEEYAAWTSAAGWYQGLLATAGLDDTPAAYWQLYLSTSLARGNYLSYLARNRELTPRFLGAVLHKKIDDQVSLPRFASVAADGIGFAGGPVPARGTLSPTALPDLVARIAGPLAEVSGPSVIEEVYAGFAGAAWFAGLWDRDMAAQLAWADDIPTYQEKARKIDEYLTTNGIKVDLDTFVESCEETSTTHVHDDHRLVMIESGQMHFWNNITHKIELNTGDKVLIPMTRLHGSTVLSGECTYHQPIIPEEMLARIC